jgi:hypothetical protein
MFWFQELSVLHVVKKKKKNPPKSRFYKTGVFSAVPSPIDLKLGGDIQTSTRNSVVGLFCLYYCLFTFRKRKQRKHTLWISQLSLKNVLKLGRCLHPSLNHNSVEPVFLIHCLFYGCKQTAQFGAILKKKLKGHQYRYQMKGLGLGSKNMFFDFRVCLHFVNINNDLVPF